MKLSAIFCVVLLSTVSFIYADTTSVAVAPHTDSVSVANDSLHTDSTHQDPVAKVDSTKSRDTSVHALSKMVVVGEKQGQANALDKQKNSDNLKNIVDADLIGKLPDESTADALQRVPGISVQRDQGEGHYVMIRGTESRLSTVTINGQTIASPDGGTRAVALNVIPADQLAEIEVSKVLMPEMDGDAIGGTVNLVTNVAKDSVLRIKASFTPGYLQLSNSPIWEGSLSGGKRFLDNALGIFLGGSYSHEQRESQGIAMTWDSSLVMNDGDTTKSHIAGRHLWSLMFRDYQNENERIAGNTKIDYRFNHDADIFLAGSMNQYSTHTLRRSLFFDMHNGDATPIGASDGSSANLVEKVPVTRSLKDALKEQTIASATLGGKVTLFGAKLDGSGSYSYGETDQPNNLTATFQRQNETFLFDPSNITVPRYTPINLATYQMNELFHQKEVFQTDTTFNDMSQYSMNSLELKSMKSTEQSLSGQFNITLAPIDILNGSLTLKSGVKGTQHTKTQSFAVTSFTDSGNYQDPNLAYFVGSYSNNSFYNGNYAFNNMPDPTKMRNYVNTPHVNSPGNFLFADSTHSQLEVDPQTFTATDRNGAGYVQAKMKWDQLTLIGGMRLEFTSMHYDGFQDTAIGYSNAIVYTSPISMYRKFLFPLPMLLGCYSIDEKTNARVSYTHTFSRPDWYDLLPREVFTTDDGELQVTAGNPDLKPTQSHNIDAEIEYFPNNIDMISGGIFYKRMEDYIFNSYRFYEMAINSPYAHSGSVSSGSHAPITAYTKENGDHADLAGFELDVTKHFKFLPGFLSGFGVSGNYCFTWSQTQMPGITQYTALPGQSSHVGNISLFYEKYGFAARFALNYQSAYINESDDYITPSGSILPLQNFTMDHLQLDCAFSQKFPHAITALLEFNNLTNTPSQLYINSRDYPTQIEYYSWSVHAGVKVDLNL